MPEYGVNAVRRAVLVLRALARSSEGRGVSDLGRDLGLGKATVFRVLQTLVDEGLVRFDDATKRYGLGPELIVLGQAASDATDIRSEARPVMERLSEQTGLPSYLNVAGTHEVVCLEHVPSMGGINLYGAAGHTMPYHACPSGLVLLAHGPSERLERIGGRVLERFGSASIVSSVELAAELARVRDQGYAVGVDDLEDGVTSIAAPIVDATTRVTASLGLAGFSHLFEGRMEELVAAVLRAAAEISAPTPARHTAPQTAT